MTTLDRLSIVMVALAVLVVSLALLNHVIGHPA